MSFKVYLAILLFPLTCRPLLGQFQNEIIDRKYKKKKLNKYNFTIFESVI